MVKEDSKAWLRLIFTRRNGLSLLLVLHFTVLLINNLPHTAFTYKVDGLYLWYLNLTGQYQKGWGMYNNPTRANDHFLVKVFDLRNQDKEYKYLQIDNPRELYFVESIAYSSNPLQSHLARAYLMFKEKDLELSQYQRVELYRYSTTINLQSGNRPQPTQVWQLEEVREDADE